VGLVAGKTPRLPRKLLPEKRSSQWDGTERNIILRATGQSRELLAFFFLALRIFYSYDLTSESVLLNTYYNTNLDTKTKDMHQEDIPAP